MYRETPNYPSATMCFDPRGQSKPEPKRYTGELVKGIVLLPKQNYTPVLAGENTDPKRR